MMYQVKLLAATKKSFSLEDSKTEAAEYLERRHV